MRATADGLLDSNVVIAIVAEAHEHHPASLALLTEARNLRLAISAHSYAEAFSTLTRRGPRAPFQWSADDAWSTLESVAAATILIGLSPAQTFDAVRSYAQAGGVGARLYDRLIGEAAVHHRIPRIITWNVGHMRGLFPEVAVVDPMEVRPVREGA